MNSVNFSKVPQNRPLVWEAKHLKKETTFDVNSRAQMSIYLHDWLQGDYSYFKLLWGNRLALSAVNRKFCGSSLPRSVQFPTEHLGVLFQKKQAIVPFNRENNTLCKQRRVLLGLEVFR